MKTRTGPEEALRCSFCHKSQDAVAKLKALGFKVAGWSASPKSLPGVTCFSGADGLKRMLAQTDMLVVLLPLVVFLGIVALFLFRLGAGDPSVIPSALIGRQAPKTVLPLHFGTFPPLTGTPEQLAALVDPSIAVVSWLPGESI